MPGASCLLLFRRTVGPPPAEGVPVYDLGHNGTGRPDDDLVGPAG